MIPKRMFFYWDKEYLSWMRYMTLYSFRKMNPDWEITLCLSTTDREWDLSREQDFLSYKGRNYFNKISELNVIIEDTKFPDNFEDKVKITTPVQYSDLYRYYKLYNNGGFYSDMDVLYFRSMDLIYNKIVLHKINTIIYQGSKYIGVGFLGSAKGNFFYRDLMLAAIDVHNNERYAVYGDELIHSLFDVSGNRAGLVEQIEEKYDKLRVYNIPESLIAHYDCSRIQYVYDTPLGVESFGSQSIGYHWYGGHSISQKYNNILNEDNYMNYKTTFSEITKVVI